MAVANARESDLWKFLARTVPAPVRSLLFSTIDLENPPDFVAFMESALAANGANRLRDAVVKMFLHRGMLAHILCNPEIISFEDASAVMTCALAADPNFDIVLLRHITDPLRSSPDEISSEEMMRALDLLHASNGIKRHMLIVMRRFLRAPDPRVRSRAVRLVTASYPAFIETAIADPDPRVRSNLLESVCEGLKSLSPLVSRLLTRASTDTNHRVSTTALFYLALHGDTGASLGLKEQLNHASPAYRRAAAWALVKLSEAQAHESSSVEPEPEGVPAAETGLLEP